MTTTEQTATIKGAVGTSRPRTDAPLKLRGQAKYAGDEGFPGLLYGRPVLSTYAHARIVSIDVSGALAVPGVHSVLLAGDLPIKETAGRSGEPLARKEIVFAGQPVALVLAESEAAAQDGVAEVIVDYEPLEAVLDVERALEDGAPHTRVEDVANDSDAGMHGYIGGKDRAAQEDRFIPNLTAHFEFIHGDAEVAFDDCAAIVEGKFRTSWMHQGYLEPQAAIAWPEGNGGVHVRASTQSVFYIRQHLARVFGIPVSEVRVEAATVGGGFGGKIGLIEPLVVGAALAVQRPVRVTFSRGEDLAAGNPAPGLIIEAKLGARADGTFVALAGRILIDSGAFTDTAPSGLAGARLAGPYRWEAWNVEAIGARTNRFGSGAYRAPTTPQITFALESLIDDLAQKLELDPVDIRHRNAASPGDRRLDGSVWPLIGLQETLDAVRNHPLLEKRDALPANEGIGIAAGHYPGAKQGAAASIRMDSDGGFTIITGYVDVSGAETSVISIAADTLGVPYEAVHIAAATDSATGPQAGVSGGSMVTYCLGSAVKLAAADAREQLLRIAAETLETEPDRLVIDGGAIYPIGSPDNGITLETLGQRLTGFGSSAPPVEGHGTALPPEQAPSASVAIAHVRVDEETGEVELLEYVAAQDVGRAINPALCQGQMRGGAVQAIGLALFEELLHDEEGQLLSGSFLSYTLPKIDRVPSIETIIVEVPSPYGPDGARGIGESAAVPGVAAVANAIAAATGVRFNHIPITPERIWRALESRPVSV